MATIGTGGTRPKIPKIVKPFIPTGTGGTFPTKLTPRYDEYKANKGSMSYSQWQQSGAPKNPVAPKSPVAPSGPDPGKVLAPVEQLPVDAQYESGLTNANKVRADAQTNAGADRTAIGSTYGYNADGTSNNSQDPFNRRLMLQQAYERAQFRTNQEAAQRGQFNSGSTQADLGYNTEQNLVQNDALIKEAQGRYQGITRGLQSADATLAESRRTLKDERIARGLTNPALDLTPKVEADNQGGNKVNVATGQVITSTGANAFGGPQMAKEFNRLKPEDQKGYQQYISQAQKSGVTVLLPWAWKAKGPGYAPTSVKGNAFGGRLMAVQFNQLSGSDQKAYQSYLLESSNNNQTALLPLKWAKQKKGV